MGNNSAQEASATGRYLRRIQSAAMRFQEEQGLLGLLGALFVLVAIIYFAFKVHNPLLLLLLLIIFIPSKSHHEINFKIVALIGMAVLVVAILGILGLKSKDLAFVGEVALISLALVFFARRMNR